MNNDSSSSSDVPRIQRSLAENEAPLEETAASDSENNQQRRKRMQRDQRDTFLDHLIRNIDIMIYCQLSILYYMDVSLPRFLLRALPQWFYFTPKPAILPTVHHYVGAIFGTNVLCVLLHTFIAPSAAGEATRGYLHGGLLIDFVGQQSPASRVHLVGLDILTLGLQLLILAVMVERRGTDKGEPSATVVDGSSLQDHDSEERGVLRPNPSIAEAFEMQPIRGRTGADVDGELDELLSVEPSSVVSDRALSSEHPLDTFNSGQHVIANLHILDTVRTQWWQYGNLATNTSGSPSETSGAVSAVEVAGRRLGFRLRVGSTEVRVG